MLGKRLSAFLLMMIVLLTLAAPSLASDVFTLHLDSLNFERLREKAYIDQALSSSAQGLRIQKNVDEPCNARLVITSMRDGSTVLDKAYSGVSGSFDSGILYLARTAGESESYLITLYLGDMGYGIPYTITCKAPVTEAAPEMPPWASESAWESNESFDAGYGWDDGWASDAEGWE